MKLKHINLLLGLVPFSLSSCTTISAYPDGAKYISGNKEYQVNIHSIDVDWINGNITFVEDVNIEGVKIEETTNLTNPKEKVHTYVDNGELKIKFFASGHTCKSISYTKDLVITYNPGIKEISAEIIDGEIFAQSLTADEVELDSISGNIDIQNIKAKQVDIESTSGNIEIDNIVATSFEIDNISGTTKLSDIHAKTFEAEFVSGNSDVKFSSIDNAAFDSVSGNIDLTLPSDGGSVKINKTSGKVTTLRECTFSNNTYIFGTGSALIDVEITSGNVTIQ